MAVQKRNISFYLALLTLLILGGGGYFVFDQYQVYTLRQNDLNTTQEQIASREIRKRQLEKTIDSYEKNEQDFLELDAILPSDKNIPELLYQLESIARKESGVAFSGVSINELGTEDVSKTNTSKFSELSLTVQIEGTYTSLKKYITSIEKNMRVADITSLQFSRTSRPGEDAPELFDFKIGMIVYYLDTHENTSL